MGLAMIPSSLFTILVNNVLLTGNAGIAGRIIWNGGVYQIITLLYRGFSSNVCLYWRESCRSSFIKIIRQVEINIRKLSILLTLKPLKSQGCLLDNLSFEFGKFRRFLVLFLKVTLECSIGDLWINFMTVNRLIALEAFNKVKCLSVWVVLQCLIRSTWYLLATRITWRTYIVYTTRTWSIFFCYIYK